MKRINKFNSVPGGILHAFLTLCVPIITILLELYKPTGTLPEILLIQSGILLYEYFSFLTDNKKSGVRVTIETYILIIVTFVLLFFSLYSYMFSFRNPETGIVQYTSLERHLPAFLIIPLIIEIIEVFCVIVDDFKKRTKGDDMCQPNTKKKVCAFPKSVKSV